ncbi:MAG: hypothetical protein E4G89_07785 [Methanothrix sp.]|nr:MAG: hypothetical protein E4G89_07785 [Methanothrix sp.]
MSKKGKKADRDNISNLADHKRFKKTLTPPLGQIPITPSSWINDRLPDMLWAVLAINFWPRDKALVFFRHIANFVHNNQDCDDITISGISHFEKEKREKFIRNLTSWSMDAKDMLRPLMLFECMPAISDWKAYLEDPLLEQDWKTLSDAVLESLWHQSEHATDCRWVKLLCMMLGRKIHFPVEMEEKACRILEYPNIGNIQEIRPTIRAMEIGFSGKMDTVKDWPKEFWKTCYEKTGCMPRTSKTDEDIQETEWIKQRQYYLEETRRIWMDLISHLFDTTSTTAIDARHEGCFGFALYSLSLFIEIILYRLDYALAGRIILRPLIECLITYKYLLDKDDNDLWKSYRSYGSGQAKLVYLKLREQMSIPNSINIEEMERIANEDMWLELVAIDLGNWENTDLRKMSESVGLKDIYDQYYGWTSGYVHATWAAIRASVYEGCLNPMHRLHRLPTRTFPKGKSVALDALKITNMILELLEKSYPPFGERLRIYCP